MMWLNAGTNSVCDGDGRLTNTVPQGGDFLLKVLYLTRKKTKKGNGTNTRACVCVCLWGDHLSSVSQHGVWRLRQLLSTNDLQNELFLRVSREWVVTEGVEGALRKKEEQKRRTMKKRIKNS